MTDVLVLGGSGVDTIVYVPELPLPYSDSYQVPAIEMRAGQRGDNVALGLSALGFTVVHVDFLGDDHEGGLVATLHERHGVPLVRVPTPAGTKRAVNLVGPDGRRLSLYDSSRRDDAGRFPDDLLKTGTRQPGRGFQRCRRRVRLRVFIRVPDRPHDRVECPVWSCCGSARVHRAGRRGSPDRPCHAADEVARVGVTGVAVDAGRGGGVAQ
ncbi:PfkB family carbohydrate kinase [Allorhizocola rhizosphaerae]|uniref:PfkB family carbohydrate kinase n=1 Tax=Allorhizocola rhizosphaerae TaxID=1872709 RepID=UPI003CCC5679